MKMKPRNKKTGPQDGKKVGASGFIDYPVRFSPLLLRIRDHDASKPEANPKVWRNFRGETKVLCPKCETPRAPRYLDPETHVCLNERSCRNMIKRGY